MNTLLYSSVVSLIFATVVIVIYCQFGISLGKTFILLDSKIWYNINLAPVLWNLSSGYVIEQ